MSLSRSETEMDAATDPLQAALRDNDRLYERLLGAQQQVGELANLLVALNSLHGAADPAGVFLAVREVVANLVGSEEFALFEIGPGNRTRLMDASGVITDALGDPAAGIQAERKTLQQYIQRAKFVIHCDPQRLEDSAHGIFVSPSAANDCGKLHRRRNRRLQDGLRHAIGVGFVGILEQQGSKRGFVKSRQ